MKFIFKDYNYDPVSKKAHFRYENNGIDFEEVIEFREALTDYNTEALEKALFLAFVLIGTSYYKTFPSKQVEIQKGNLDQWQAHFFDSVYEDGLSQFAFENALSRDDLAQFNAGIEKNSLVDYISVDSTPLVLQSGGKDSLLLSKLLSESSAKYDTWFLQTSDSHPVFLDDLGERLITAKRILDKASLQQAAESGGLNGHVPVTYIVLSIALMQAILLGKDTVLAAIGHEGEEPYDLIGDLPVMHQWAKTWKAEQQFSEYVKRYISKDIKVGSPLRKYSELKIAELFVENCWQLYSRKFSSCNIGNYKQGQDNQALGWCGNCAKCANSFLLFAPFVGSEDLTQVFNCENLFENPSLTETFKGLLGIEEAVKPFECVGEEAELRKAYQMALEKSLDYKLPFDVPDSDFDYREVYSMQSWADRQL